MIDITILIVEDDYLNRRLVKKVLQERGYKILEAKSGDEAVTQLLNNRIDLFILDIKLGVHDREGIGLGTYLKGRYAIPFIYLTAYQTHEVLNDALATSPHSYLTKPFRNTDLIASVELALQKSAEREKNLPYVVLKVKAFTVKLPLERIDYIESEGNYLLVYSNNMVYRSRGTIKEILVSLPADTFLQTHRAFIVNKNKIDRFSAKSLMIKRHSIPVSKNYIPDIQAIYGVADW